ncbi:MAG: nucleotide exchange factor GrpE [Dehalococcoidia bacterium]
MGPEDTKRETPASSKADKDEKAASAASEELEQEEPDLQSLKETLAKEKEQSERYLANWQRAQADFINYKKRVEQEREEIIKYRGAGLIINLLSILDDFDRALENMPPKLMGLTWVEGIFLMQKKLLAILEGQGLSQIKALGEKFDPSLHEAVMYGEGEEGKVVEELQKGYKFHDRVMRPAMVQVGKGADKKDEESEKAPDEKEPG